MKRVSTSLPRRPNSCAPISASVHARMTGAVALVEVGEPRRSTPASSARPLAPGVERAERLGERLHLVGDLGHERAEQVFLVGEVQVEGAVRGLGELDDVVDARGVVAPRREDLDAGVEQLAQRALPAGPQLAALGRGSARRVPSSASWRPGAGRELPRLATGVGGRSARTRRAGVAAVAHVAGHRRRVGGCDARVTFRTTIRPV